MYFTRAYSEIRVFRVFVALFSRNGFTDAVRDAAAERSDLRLYSLSDVVEAVADEAPDAA